MQVNLSHDAQCRSPISVAVMTQLIYTILQHLQHHCFLTVNLYLCSTQKIRRFNATFRGIDRATDILSFAPHNTLTILPMYHLGDLVIAPKIVAKYSTTHHIPLQQHWYHLITHGVLHLLGYDHVDPAEARVMEALEQVILQQFTLKIATQDLWLQGEVISTALTDAQG